MNKILLYLGALVLGFIIGWAAMTLAGDRLLSLIGGPYYLPSNLTHSQESGWKDIEGAGWTFSVKESWALTTPVELSSLGLTSVLTNQREDKESFTVMVLPMPGGQTLDELMEDAEENLDQSMKYLGSSPSIGKPKILKSKTLTINGHDAGVLFIKMELKEEDFDIITGSVFLEKSDAVYYLLIATTNEFYKSNQEDVQTLISSFR
jgi:hypothetical protein